MKIRDVEALVLSCPLEAPLRLSFGTMKRRQAVLIQVLTNEGVVGLGECWSNFPEWAPYVAKRIVEGRIRSVLLDEDPLQKEVLWKRMYKALFRLGLQSGCKGPMFHVMSGVDIALHDIEGKAKKKSVSTLLGTRLRDRASVYASGLAFGDPKQLAQQAVEYLDRGFTAMKMRVGFGAERDLENVRAVRNAVGNDVQLMVDANMAWSPREAIAMAKKLERFELYWLEEPVSCEDAEGSALVAATLEMPVALGENAYGVQEFVRLLETRAGDIFQPDVTKSGGLAECRKISALASDQGIPIAAHFYGGAIGLAATLQLFASLPNALMIELDVTPNPLRDEVLVEPLHVEHGYIAIPRAPGLGVEIKPDLQSFSYEWERD